MFFRTHIQHCRIRFYIRSHQKQQIILLSNMKFYLQRRECYIHGVKLRYSLPIKLSNKSLKCCFPARIISCMPSSNSINLIYKYKSWSLQRGQQNVNFIPLNQHEYIVRGRGRGGGGSRNHIIVRILKRSDRSYYLKANDIRKTSH